MKQLICRTLLGLMVLQANAQTPAAMHFNTESGVALNGYDPVAYFTRNKAVKGKKEFNFTTSQVTYYFESAAARELFSKNPTHYQPQYGGWCAYAMGASGEKVDVDPETFKILNGKLYLFYNRLFNNTLTKWNADEPNLKSKADANWSKLNK
ncbi:MAG: YHS domain protein [Cytophagales bacterium]|nr:YHS domain protein [Cytophagales bacterium]